MVSTTSSHVFTYNSNLTSQVVGARNGNKQYPISSLYVENDGTCFAVSQGQLWRFPYTDPNSDRAIVPTGGAPSEIIIDRRTSCMYGITGTSADGTYGGISYGKNFPNLNGYGWRWRTPVTPTNSYYVAARQIVPSKVDGFIYVLCLDKTNSNSPRIFCVKLV